MNYDQLRTDERIELALKQSARLDSQESVFFAKELTHVMAQSYDRKYPEFTALRVFPISTEVHPGATSIDWHSYEGVGLAEIIANYADDLPRVDVVGKAHNAKIHSIGVSYGYSIQDLRAAQMAGKPLEQRRSDQAKRANDLRVNKIAFFGDKENGLVGLLTHPDIPEYILATGGGGTALSGKTDEEVLADLNGMVQSVIKLTNGVEAPNTMLMPPAMRADLASRRLNNSDMTVLNFFLANNGYISRVEASAELSADNAGSNTIIMGTFTPEYMTLQIPQMYEQFPPQENNLYFKVPCHSRTAGVLVYYPLAFVKAVGA